MLNNVVLMGRLTDNVDYRQTQGGTNVSRFSLAVQRDFARQGEEKSVDYIDIVAWGKSADFANNYFNKGQLVCVRGRLEARSYDDRNGIRRKSVTVVAENLYFAESKKDSYSQPAANGGSNEPAPSFSNNDDGDFQEVGVVDDDLPF